MTRTTATRKTIEHPTWCYPGWCSVKIGEDGYHHGEHHRSTITMPKVEGGVLHVGLTADALGGGEDVAVTIHQPLSEDFEVPPGHEDTSEVRRSMGSRIGLEPEEARMLARYLVKAADEWDRRDTLR